MKKLLLFIPILIMSFTAMAQKVYTISQGNGEIYRPNASFWYGGDTIKITGKSYSVIEFTGVNGYPGRPITIIFPDSVKCGAFRIKGNCSYINVIADKLKINGALSVQLAHHIYWKGGEIYGSSIGIYCKQDAVYGDKSTYGTSGYVMRKITFDGVYIHDVSGEGTYIGHTSPEGQLTRRPGLTDTLISTIPLDSVSFINSRVENCGWDGVQISHAGRGNLIANNLIKNVGQKKESNQGNGAMIGGNSQGDILNNYIENSNGAGIAVFGFGIVNVKNNRLMNTGITANEPAMYFKKNHNLGAKLQVNVINNLIYGASRDGIVNAVRTDWGLPGKWDSNKILDLRSGFFYKSTVSDIITNDGRYVPVGDNPPTDPTVPKAQYDSLLIKYRILEEWIRETKNYINRP